MNPERRTPLALAAGTAAARAQALERARFESYALGFSSGWSRAVEMLAASMEETISEEAFAEGARAGRREANADHDRIWRNGWEDGVRDSAAVVKKLRDQLAELEVKP
jgi:hypothetical protein